MCAIIVPVEAAKRKQESSAISLEELREWAKDKLAPYKVWQHRHLSFLKFLEFQFVGGIFSLVMAAVRGSFALSIKALGMTKLNFQTVYFLLLSSGNPGL